MGYPIDVDGLLCRAFPRAFCGSPMPGLNQSRTQRCILKHTFQCGDNTGLIVRVKEKGCIAGDLWQGCSI
jgi:hypothetical protein